MHIHRMMNDYVEATKNNKIIVGRNKILSGIGWTSPKMDWVSLNTDGACLDGRESRCGGVIKISNSEYLGGFAKHLNHYSVVKAEHLGVYEGLKLVRAMGLSKVDL